MAYSSDTQYMRQILRQIMNNKLNSCATILELLVSVAGSNCN